MPKSKSQAAKAAIKKKSAPRSGNSKSAGVPAAMRSERSVDVGAGMRVSHREFVTSFSANSVPFVLMGNSAFTPGYDLNPANVLLFPWLSTFARSYEKYRFERVRFELVPKNPTTMSGSVYAGFDYDFDDSVATSEAELMVNRGAISGDVWSPKVLDVDIKRVNEDVPWRYCQLGLRGAGTGRMVYGGYLMVGVSGTSALATFDLYVSYTVQLSLPAIHNSVYNKAVFVPETTLSVGGYCALPVLPDVGPSMQRVAVADTPITAYFQPTNQVYRIADAGATGVFELTTKTATAGSTPASFAADTTATAAIFDSAGTTLATTLSALGNAGIGKTGPESAALWETAGSAGRLTWSVALEALRKRYPTVAYLAPYLQSLAGRVLTSPTAVDGRYTEL